MSKGSGKKTARSQAWRANDALRKYGYPSMRELRREAQGLAGASVPTVRATTRPYRNQIQSSKDYLQAVNAVLASMGQQTSQDYGSAVQTSQNVDQAAQARLASLGLGADAAGTQAAVGARGDSATQNLISNQAAAQNYANQLPAVATGQATQFADVTRNKMLDALSQRKDALSQAFFQALQQVQSNALSRAQFNQSSDQFTQSMAMQEAQMRQAAQQFAAQQASSDRSFAEGKREFNITERDRRAAARAKLAADAALTTTSITDPTVKYSATENKGFAQIAGKFYDPTSSESVSQGQTDSKGVHHGTSSTVVTHEKTAPLNGIPFDTTVQDMMNAGLPPDLAFYYASGLYNQFGSARGAYAAASSWARANGRTGTTYKNFLTSDLWKTAQSAYFSFYNEYGQGSHSHSGRYGH